MSYVNRKRMAAVPARLATWALLAIATAAFAFGLTLSSPLAAMADEGGLAAAPLATQDDHGAVKYGPYEVGSPNAADVTATIYEDGTMVIDGTGDVVNVTGAATWRRLLGWSPSSGSNATEQMLAIKRVEFGDSVAPVSLNRWFWKCENLEYVNRIPSSVTDLRYAFSGCASFVNFPAGFAIPQGAQIGSMFTVSDPYSESNPLVTICDASDYEALSIACDWSSYYRKLVFLHDPFDITCTVGANATASDGAQLLQTGVTTVMNPVTVIPAEGYKLATPTISPADAGVTAEGNQYTGWTVSGLPTAAVTVTFADAEQLDTHSVKTTLAQNMTTADEALLDQVVPEYPGSMTRFTVSPAEGYKVPQPTVEPADAGVSVSGSQYNGWTVSGTPTANVTVTFADAGQCDVYSVATTLGQNMSVTDEALLAQSVTEPKAMTRFTVSPAEGYKVPQPTVEPVDAGVSVSGNAFTGWTIAGTPTTNVTIAFTDADTVQSVTLFSEEGDSSFTSVIQNPSIVLKGASVQAVYEGPCESQYFAGLSLYVALDPSTSPDETLFLQLGGTTNKYGCYMDNSGQGMVQLRNGAANVEGQIVAMNRYSYYVDGRIWFNVHIGIAGDPMFTPEAVSSDAGAGTVSATFVYNEQSASIWKVEANATNDWCEFDKFVDENGKSYNGTTAFVKVSKDGAKITGNFKSKIDPLYNETDAESVKVRFTLSNDGVPLAGVDGTVLAGLEEEVPYFDLGLYGLAGYNRYHTAYGWGAYSDDVVVKRPTALHAYIWFLERYYLGLPAEDCGKGTSDLLSYKDDTTVSYFDGEAAYRSGRTPAILPSGAATSLYLSNFWGHDQNLMYFVNHGFPVMSKGIGATCDYVLLEDGDTIDVGLFSWWDFYLSGGFCQFDQDSYVIDRGDTLTVSTLKSETRESSEGVVPAAGEINTLKVAVYDSEWEKVADLEGSGSYSYTFPNPGTYYLLGTDPAAKNPEAACLAPAVAKVEVAAAPDRDENGAFLLSNVGDMAWFQDYVNNKGHYDARVALTDDIDMSSLEWTGLGETEGNLFNAEGIQVGKAFSGELDGRGHTLTVALTTDPLCTLLTGTVKDLTITGTCAAPASFATYISFGAQLLNCTNEADVTGSVPDNSSNHRSAGIAVYSVPAYRGNVAEESAMRIEGCVNKGAVSSSSSNQAAGILYQVTNGYNGYKTTWGNMLTITGCSNEGNVSVANSSYNPVAAGVLGDLSVSDCIVLEDCANSGNIIGGSGGYAAGIIASSNPSEQIVSRCVNTGDVTGSASYAGGVFARDNGSSSLISECSNTGSISGFVAGGIVGYNYSEIGDCYNWGAVAGGGMNQYGSKGSAGGIAGVHNGWQIPDTWSYSGAPISRSYTTGSVASGEGGIAGAVVGSLYERGYEEPGYYSGTVYSDISACWLEGSADAAVGMIGNDCAGYDKTQMKTVAEMRYDALLGELGEAFQASCPYPALAWQEAAEHSWGDGIMTVEPTVGAEGEMSFECTVCGETKTEALPKADASEIQAAIDAAKAIDTSALTDEQKADLEAAIAAAEAAAGDEGTTASQLDAALAALELQTAKADAAVARAEAAAAQQAAIDAAKSACEAAGIDYDPNKSPADNVAAANTAQQAALGVANAAAEEAAKKACEAAGVEYDPAKSPAENVAAANDAQQAKLAQAEKAAEAAEARAIAAETAQKAAEAASAGLKANPMKATGKTIKAKAKKKTRAAKAKAFQVEGAKGKVSFYKAKGNDKIAVKANGKVIVKKGLKRGKTYKVKVLVVAEGDKEFAPAFKTVILKVKVAKK